MEKNEIKKLISLRKFVINQYSRLDGDASPHISVIKQSYVAEVYEEIIKKVDDMLSSYVSFEKRE